MRRMLMFHIFEISFNYSNSSIEKIYKERKRPFNKHFLMLKFQNANKIALFRSNKEQVIIKSNERFDG